MSHAETERGNWLKRLAERVGPHPARRLGLDLATPRGRARWLVAVRLAAERDAPRHLDAALEALERDAGTGPSALAAAGPEHVAARLSEAGLRRADAVAASLCRAGIALRERHGGDLEALASDALDLDELGARLVALAPGLGPATVLRFLRPLRAHWSAARETPVSEATRAAAEHLGMLRPGEDSEGEPSTLVRACRELAAESDFADIEFALDTLGTRACRRERLDRCLLGDACPAR